MSKGVKQWARSPGEPVEGEPLPNIWREQSRARRITREIEVPEATALLGASASVILTIDAYRPLANALHDLLGARGWQVEKAYDGREALRLIELLRPDVVVCDLELRQRPSAFDLASVLRAHPRYEDIFLVATTSREIAECQEQTLAMGFDAILQKPVDVETIEALIAERCSAL